MTSKKAYIIYQFEDNDFRYIKEYYNIKDIQNDYKLKNKKSIYNNMVNSIDNINCNNLLYKKYLIVKENLEV